MISGFIEKGEEERNLRRPFLEAANVANDLNGQVQKTPTKS
jgi:hypothetical protein